MNIKKVLLSQAAKKLDFRPAGNKTVPGTHATYANFAAILRSTLVRGRMMGRHFYKTLDNHNLSLGYNKMLYPTILPQIHGVTKRPSRSSNGGRARGGWGLWLFAHLVLGIRVALGVAVDVRPAQKQRDNYDHQPLGDSIVWGSTSAGGGGNESKVRQGGRGGAGAGGRQNEGCKEQVESRPPRKRGTKDHNTAFRLL